MPEQLISRRQEGHKIEIFGEQFNFPAQRILRLIKRFIISLLRQS
jgi:hypothetical protein